MQPYTLNLVLSAKVNKIEKSENIHVVNIFKPELKNGKYCVNYSFYPGDGKIHAHYTEVCIGSTKTVDLYNGMEMTLSFPYNLLQEGFYKCTVLM